jgi:hypothetical protein
VGVPVSGSGRRVDYGSSMANAPVGDGVGTGRTADSGHHGSRLRGHGGEMESRQS